MQKENTSPNLDKWTTDAVIFSSAISQSANSSPSFLALLSGQYPSKFRDWFGMVSPERTMAAEIFAKNGFITCGLHYSPYMAKFYKFDRGFHLFADVDNSINWKNNAFSRATLSILSKWLTLAPKHYGTSEKVNKKVNAWLENTIEPYFLWIYYIDVHGPYVASQRWNLKNRLSAGLLWRKALNNPEAITKEESIKLKRDYKRELKHLDYNLGKLLEKFDPTNTIIIITADHGQCFGEHGHYGHPLELYEELIRVPLLIKFPKSLGIERKYVREPVRSIDILPTLIDFLDLNAETSFDGESFLPLLKGKNGHTCKECVSEVSRKHVSVIKDNWKLIINYEKNERKLFDLESDPLECMNLVNEHPEITHKLEFIIKEHIKKNKVDNIPIIPEVTPDAKITTELRIMGYIKK